MYNVDNEREVRKMKKYLYLYFEVTEENGEKFLTRLFFPKGIALILILGANRILGNNWAYDIVFVPSKNIKER